MTLADYLLQNDISYADFARRIGAANAGTVRRYAIGMRHPRPAPMAAIVRETGGAVTANDFFGVEEVAA